ncbi:IclR family transcriptional regulator [bacterium]|nr:MAG: IclR family transcriptional regulator [bacterium]
MLNNRSGSIQVLRRASALLDALASSRRPMSLTELFRQVGLNKSTTLNILATLVSLGFVSVGPEGRQYRLGPRLLELGAAFGASFEIVEQAKPLLLRLRDATLETASLHIRVDSERTCIAQMPGSHAIRRVVELGRRRPLYSGAAGLVLLGDLSNDELAAYLEHTELIALTPNTITDKHQLSAAVEAARSDGFAAAFEDTEIGASAGAVPVRDHANRICAALVVSGPATRFDRRAIDAAAPTLRECAEILSRQLGWSDRARATGTAGAWI